MTVTTNIILTQIEREKKAPIEKRLTKLPCDSSKSYYDSINALQASGPRLKNSNETRR